MTQSVRFYRDVLGMELLYGGEGTGFSSLRAKDIQSTILNLEQGKPVPRWGRLIFYVTDVDVLWNHLKDRGFDPEILFLARKMGFKVSEVPVTWGHSGGSRINPLVDGARMFTEMLRVRWYDLTGKYDAAPAVNPVTTLPGGPGPA